MTTLPRSFTLPFVTRTRKHSQDTQTFATIWFSLTVTTDSHHDLRTSQKAEFPPSTLYPYRKNWRSPRSPDFIKGRVSTLHTVPVLLQLTVTTISVLHKRRSFHLAHWTCRVTADGHHDLRTVQRRSFHFAQYTCRRYVILLCSLHSRVG